MADKAGSLDGVGRAGNLGVADRDGSLGVAARAGRHGGTGKAGRHGGAVRAGNLDVPGEVKAAVLAEALGTERQQDHWTRNHWCGGHGDWTLWAAILRVGSGPVAILRKVSRLMAIL